MLFSAALAELILSVAALSLAYLLPSVVALARGVPTWRGVLCPNLAYGWTIVGWCLALWRATRRVRRRPHVAHHASVDHAEVPWWSPTAPERATVGESIYRDGAHLISAHDEART